MTVSVRALFKTLIHGNCNIYQKQNKILERLEQKAFLISLAANRELKLQFFENKSIQVMDEYLLILKYLDVQTSAWLDDIAIQAKTFDYYTYHETIFLK